MHRPALSTRQLLHTRDEATQPPRAAVDGGVRPACVLQWCGGVFLSFFFFFLKNRPPPKFSPFPHPAPLPSPKAVVNFARPPKRPGGPGPRGPKHADPV